MEVFLTLVVLLTTCFTIMVLNWAVNRHRRLKVFKQYGIPGPEPHFVSGNMSQLKSKPEPNTIITAWLNKYGKVFGYFIGEIPYVVVNDLEMLKQIFIKDFHVFSNRPNMALDVVPLNKTLLALRDKRWKEVRALLTPTFSSGKIKLMTCIVAKKVDVTVDVVTKKAESNEMFDMYELVQGLTLDVIADCALAMKTHCQVNPKDILSAKFAIFGPSFPESLRYYPPVTDLCLESVVRDHKGTIRNTHEDATVLAPVWGTSTMIRSTGQILKSTQSVSLWKKKSINSMAYMPLELKEELHRCKICPAGSKNWPFTDW
ncbi:cytochrome P450 3A31 [Caerostris extrusa]|uniref:Cytochrome P450 3A31 n=1 Tax=Caerostris extrusa TaxID=172846 RepID=A0AAV4NZJ1_CAEEX|nr:cytochrome P450 3A31 [Caerostris extrusa]